MKNNYEELKINDEKILEGLNKVISTIDYNPKNVQTKMHREGMTKEYAMSRVSKFALDDVIANNRDVATYDCNVYKFNNICFDFLTEKIMSFVKDRGIQKVAISGRIWYPVYGYMGWHTNSNNKGYRLYCTFAREGGKSFFRYRDPDSKEIITSMDNEGWNFRIFRISDNHLWHSVFSETDRFSIGYSLYT